MKIHANTHGIIDYVVVLFLALSPTLFGLSPEIATFTYILAAVHLALTLCTNFKAGILKVIPFRVHGLIELVVAVALFGLSFYFGGIGNAGDQYFYMGFALAVLITWLVTDYKTA